MRLDSIIELAARIRAHDPIGGYVPSRLARELADVVLDVLRVEMPCGFDEPRAAEDECGNPVVFWDGSTYTREEALGIAAAIARCALELPEGK